MWTTTTKLAQGALDWHLPVNHVCFHFPSCSSCLRWLPLSQLQVLTSPNQSRWRLLVTNSVHSDLLQGMQEELEKESWKWGHQLSISWRREVKKGWAPLLGSGCKGQRQPRTSAAHEASAEIKPEHPRSQLVSTRWADCVLLPSVKRRKENISTIKCFETANKEAAAKPQKTGDASDSFLCPYLWTSADLGTC